MSRDPALPSGQGRDSGAADPDASLAEEMLALLAGPNEGAAGTLCAALVDLGTPLQTIVDQGLAPAMARVGTMVESGVASIADEHRLTAAAQGALSAAAGHAGRSSKGPRTAVVACADGDWHSLPTRAIAEVLMTDGWSVRFLGASRSPRSLVAHLIRQPADVVLLGCAVTSALPAVVDAVHQIHRLGIPVCVGGSALGADSRRAERIGADGWAADAGGVLRLLSTPLVRRAEAVSSQSLHDYLVRRAGQRRWVSDALEVMTQPFPPGCTADPHASTGDHLTRLLDTACIAVLLDDATVMEDECAWLGRMLGTRGAPVSVLLDGLLALSMARAVTPRSAAVHAVLRHSLQRGLCTAGDVPGDGRRGRA